MEMVNECSHERFLTDVAGHKMHILMDNPDYRHVLFTRPASSVYRFGLITWPGYLCFYGDMGSFVFTRLKDMFEFFRAAGMNACDGINPSYWGEKCVALDREGIRKYSAEKLEAWTTATLNEWIESARAEGDFTDDDATELSDAFNAEMGIVAHDGTHAVIHALSEFRYVVRNHRFEVSDYWELAPSFEDYTYRFIWCCRAIAWGIRQYDDARPA